MVIQFNYFMSNRRGFEPQNGRCKIQPIEMFDAEGKWLIDDWWTNEEKVALGIEDEVEEYTSEKIFIKLNELVSSVEEIKDKLRDTFDSQPNDADYFYHYIWERRIVCNPYELPWINTEGIQSVRYWSRCRRPYLYLLPWTQ